MRMGSSDAALNRSAPVPGRSNVNSYSALTISWRLAVRELLRPGTSALLLLVALVTFATGCVSKSTAEARMRMAYLAGQHDAMARMQQQHAEGGNVTFNGPFNNPV